MQIIKYIEKDLEKYCQNLKIVSSISKLFSDNDAPMIYYRATEFIYCKSFNAEDLSRTDMSADAKYGNVGIGIKTFLEGNKKTFQKIAEFNKEQSLYTNLEINDKIKKIAELRNERILSTMRTFGLDSMIYHCIIRNKDGLNLYEEPMILIDIDKINIQKSDRNIIIFNDGKHIYKFNNTKSTLYKQFFIDSYFKTVDIIVLEEPLLMLNNITSGEYSTSDYEFLILPLYSTKNGINFVAEKSGLNQWNAGGRVRNENEVYIPFPAEAREKFRDFFPDRDESFEVILPNGSMIKMKVCQDKDKAIMSNPNKALGKWLLRDILGIREHIVLTYDLLLSIGIDSVMFEKKDGVYYLNFKEIGTYEEFLNSFFS